MPVTRRRLAALAVPLLAMPVAARAASRRDIDDAVAPALARLREEPGTRVLAENARAILVFPRIIRGGFVFGGQYGTGAMIQGAETVGYYSIAGASFGLQVGAQSYGLAMFVMTDGALDFFHRSQGWEIGTGPSVVALDAGLAGSLTSTTMSQDVYAMTFGQTGLMAALTLDGQKITRITPE
ncbi:lipid-binding SYLF domain-containing protein [Roseicella aquatilis]|uniref:Twin-arginine translocation pathway signal protein n=1 Tax=Roseicella aquatilis TaxID=2527868 RepID=A0A4R4DSP6_9PROT|nr:lipid-binding SYLF domain-containing protein [Roseicella aquatilis]TCZ64395.1 twin-arginine translocation pathway signal protein [Roseicella aquatilis]